MVVGDKFKYQCLGYDPVNSPGDYIIVEVLQPAVAELDESNNTYYRIIGQVINDESDIINCSLFFSKPNNLICVTEVSQIALLPPPPGGNEVAYTVEIIGSNERPTTTGSTTIVSSNITSLSERSIHSQIGSLLASVQLNVNEFIHSQITRNLVTQIGPLLAEQEAAAAAPSSDTGTAAEIDALKARLDELEARIVRLEARG